MEKIIVSKVENDQISEIVSYIIECRKQLFPMLDPNVIPKDLIHFEQNYIQSKTGAFLQVYTPEGRVIGGIGMMPYDYRFSHLGIDEQPTVEVARLFIEPVYRRLGLGSEVFKALLKRAKETEVERLYLHTHPFLAGAYEFWLRQGFRLLKRCDESGFETLHMELMVSAHRNRLKNSINNGIQNRLYI